MSPSSARPVDEREVTLVQGAERRHEHDGCGPAGERLTAGAAIVSPHGGRAHGASSARAHSVRIVGSLVVGGVDGSGSARRERVFDRGAHERPEHRARTSRRRCPRSAPAACADDRGRELGRGLDRLGVRGRSASAITTGSPPISTTSACAIGSTGVGAVTANQLSRKPRSRSMLVPVNAMAGWIASGIAPAASAGASTSVPKPRSRVQHELAGLPGAGRGESATRLASWSPGTARMHEFAALDDLRHVEDRHAREDRLGPVAALLRDRGDADDRVAGAGEGRAEDGPTRPAPMMPTPRRPDRWVVASRAPDRQRWLVSVAAATAPAATRSKKRSASPASTRRAVR